jgi:hypothetical protein
MTSGVTHANGLGESAPWQFRTDFERAALAGIADMIERKKGGFYDGFTTVVNSYTTTNVGTQINCSNGANAIGNQAENGQSGNSPILDASGENRADATGNDSNSTTTGDGGTNQSDQTNDGTVSAGAEGNSNDIDTGSVDGGETDSALNNDQDNSGTQSADVTDSIACDFPGASVVGDVVSNPSTTFSTPLN